MGSFQNMNLWDFRLEIQGIQQPLRGKDCSKLNMLVIPSQIIPTWPALHPLPPVNAKRLVLQPVCTKRSRDSLLSVRVGQSLVSLDRLGGARIWLQTKKKLVSFKRWLNSALRMEDKEFWYLKADPRAAVKRSRWWWWCDASGAPSPLRFSSPSRRHTSAGLLAGRIIYHIRSGNAFEALECLLHPV